MNIHEAIAQLGPDDYIDGLPKLSVIQKLTGDRTIRSADVMAVLADQIIDEPADLGDAIREEVADPVVGTEHVPTECPLPDEGQSDCPSPHEALRAAEHALDMARYEAREAGVTVKRHRAALAAALARWTASGPIYTPEMAARDFIAQGVAERAARAAGRAARRTQRHLPSAVDAMAAATVGGSYRAGGGFAYKRGAMSLAQSQAKLNEAARAKLVGGDGE